MSSLASGLIKAGIRGAPTVAATAAVALVVSVASLFGGVPGGDESDSSAECEESQGGDGGCERDGAGRRCTRRDGGEGDRASGENRVGSGSHGGINRSVSWGDELGEELVSVIHDEHDAGMEVDEYYEEFDYDINDEDRDSDDDDELCSKGDQNGAKRASGGNAGNNHDITPQSGGTGTLAGASMSP